MVLASSLAPIPDQTLKSYKKRLYEAKKPYKPVPLSEPILQA